MSTILEILAPCKINLHLRVCERRADGYHDIESVFQLISFGDKLSVSIEGAPGSCSVDSPLMQLPPENTISHAVHLFREVTGVDAGVRILVQKLVPSGAGLGGGSSDAASVLSALDTLCDTRLSMSQLVRMAGQIGSDVPFFLSGGAAVVSGRGEHVRSIPARTDLFGVLVHPGVFSSTVHAYGLVDRWHEQYDQSIIDWPVLADLERMYHSEPSSWRFKNSFTAPVEHEYPVIKDVREAFHSYGACFAEMSGSGSSVFGLFLNKDLAEKCCAGFISRGFFSVEFLLLASSSMQ